MKSTIIDMFEGAVATYPSNVFLKEKIGTEWQATTYKEVQKEVYRFGAGLKALGVKKGDNAALLSEGRNAWIIGELALFYAGAANVPLSVKLEERGDLIFRLVHSNAEYILVSAGQLPKIRKIKSELPNIKQIIIFDTLDSYEELEISMADVCKMGDKLLLDEGLDNFLEIAESIQNNDLATITYTSGTTADPKGVMLTHRNYTANVEQALTLMSIPETYKTLIILPLDHCFAHVVGFYIFMHRGASVATVQNGKTPMNTLKNIPINIKEIKPDLILSVPALAKSFKKNIENSIRSKGKFTESLFNFGLSLSKVYARDGWSRGKGLRVFLYPLIMLLDKILFSKVREAFGGDLKMFIGGGALLSTDLQDFYYAIGIPMFQGYGLSEATPVISSNSMAMHKFGSSGVLVKPLEIKILDNDGKELRSGVKGEIVVRGENVMAGYWKNSQATAETVIDGWLHTGDLGYMDRDGFLVVLGRFKSLLIGSDGEKYSPEGIEEALIDSSPYIDQMILYNNQSTYTTALIVPNLDALKRDVTSEWGSNEAKRQAIELVRNSINMYTAGGEFAGQFPERWLPATFALLDTPFTEQNLMVNSTAKVVRGKVESYFADRIEMMYNAKTKDIFNDKNFEALDR